MQIDHNIKSVPQKTSCGVDHNFRRVPQKTSCRWSTIAFKARMFMPLCPWCNWLKGVLEAVMALPGDGHSGDTGRKQEWGFLLPTLQCPKHLLVQSPRECDIILRSPAIAQQGHFRGKMIWSLIKRWLHNRNIPLRIVLMKAYTLQKYANPSIKGAQELGFMAVESSDILPYSSQVPAKSFYILHKHWLCPQSGLGLSRWLQVLWLSFCRDF